VAIAQACEAILLSSGLAESAYDRYALLANQTSTHLATFRAIQKKYPDIAAERILRDLIASTPGQEGKWFAAAKDAAFFDLAIELIRKSPADPRTLTRAAIDFADQRPAFALEVAVAALHWIGEGYGYEITGLEVLQAHSAIVKAATNAALPAEQLDEIMRQLLNERRPHAESSALCWGTGRAPSSDADHHGPKPPMPMRRRPASLLLAQSAPLGDASRP
jgi:hypothetical protein